MKELIKRTRKALKKRDRKWLMLRKKRPLVTSKGSEVETDPDTANTRI